MAATLNYIVEANVGLLLALVFYFTFLRQETKFTLMRFYLLTSICASLLFPLIDVQSTAETPALSISRLLPSYWLPEVVINAEGGAVTRPSSLTVWQYAAVVYWCGLVLCSLFVLLQLLQLLRLFRKTKTYRREELLVAESAEDKPTFSFFNFIFIGKAHELSPREKEQILRHESVHARQWHSLDILVVNLLKIFFWFNPFISTYKRTFVKLHEFEADARAVENGDVDKYCSLLARVALRSADFTLANHFNNSLTVKRIEMMRTIKSNIRSWKLAALASMLPLLFFFIACNDQVEEDVMTITKNSSHALIIPPEVQNRFSQLQKENPDKKYSVLELNETASEKITDLESKYGLPQSMEIFRVKDGKVIEAPMRGESASGVQLRESENALERRAKEDFQTFAILEFTDEAKKLSEASVQDGKVFTVVEQQPEYSGGYEQMVSFLSQNILYPKDARTQGLQGTVYVSFIVEKDGAITNTKVVRGVSQSVDEEAKRVVESFPNWTPGKQNGQPVRVQFVLPIKFALGGE